MKCLTLLFLVCIVSILPGITSAQTDSAKQIIAIDSTTQIVADTTAAVKKNADTTIATAVPSNCYKQWLDVVTELGSKPLADGTHAVVIAFKSKESCHCYMGKVAVSGGKMTAPLYVETEGGDFKTFTAMGKKMDPEFLAAQGDALWNISNGMSVLFQTTEGEYGRVFFYKSLNKNKGMNKEAPSPADLLN
jgi:hypothetical protein